ncbi:MAG: SoxR reducing system RseC family protein [Nitrospirae bacterium]|nr:SoxR reducing system RseC family protein [Nitrospirota bacterium]MCL5237559.1 SoxR reducing system RseC family protein [Nitrospirota bacterium]
MKPTIPETGTVVKLDGKSAVILLQGGEPCKGCGAGKIGLCRPGGHTRVLTLKNSAGALIGDTVTIGLDQDVQLRGYLLSYIIPCASLVFGTLGGHLLGEYFRLSPLDVISGFTAFIIASLYSLKRLRRLDSSSSLEIKKVLSGAGNTGTFQSEEERTAEHYISGC